MRLSPRTLISRPLPAPCIRKAPFIRESPPFAPSRCKNEQTNLSNCNKPLDLPETYNAEIGPFSAIRARKHGKKGPNRAIHALVGVALLVTSSALAQIAPVNLNRGWTLQSSGRVPQKGAEISTSHFRTRTWYPVDLPSTVVGALVANKVYPDPYFGMNLRSIPGTTYNIGMNFANLPMPDDSPFRPAWWYRTEFRVPASAKGKTLWLDFDAINYRANIWLNGRQIATADQAAGMYRMFEFDITALAKPGAVNVLALEVFPPTPTDLGFTFVDWNPMTADKEMGIVRDVFLRTSGPVAVRHSFVATRLENDGAVAKLTVHTLLKNATRRDVDGTLNAQVGNVAVSKKVRVPAQQSLRESFDVTVDHPELWWPYPLGPQNLHKLVVTFETAGAVSDRHQSTFGIREITSELDAGQHRVFRINGKNILIRGGCWTQDLLLKVDDEREDHELRYAQEMNLNTVRLEGKLMNDHFYDACDRKGILVMAGWCCCSYWERWKQWKPDDYTAAGEALRDQIRRIEGHPSLLTWVYGSDNSPDAKAEGIYLDVLKSEHWPNPSISSATDAKTPGAGRTGVKMPGPYEYVAPNYWLLDRDRGGAFGFNTETSPGPAIPVLESIQQMLPKEHWWPIDDFWNFHAGGGNYKNVNVFTTALEARYGKARGLEDYLRKSQMMAYEGQRAMFEAYGKNKYKATGVVQWMLNNAWPSIIWHLYDYYLRPGGGYFGTKKANEPLHVQYSYDDQSIVVVNSFYRSFPGHKVTVRVFNLDLTEKFSRTVPLNIAPDSSTAVLTLPSIDGLSPTYFVRLSLDDAAGKLVSSNFYWLSTQPDVSDWPKGNGRYTPIKTYAGLTAIDALPPANVRLSWVVTHEGADEVVRVTVMNPSPRLAFFLHLKLKEDFRPVYWDDNYVTLLPGEKRELTARYPRKLNPRAVKPQVMVD
jgi:exo-1,4-beta-D-glucosaminidase